MPPLTPIDTPTGRRFLLNGVELHEGDPIILPGPDGEQHWFFSVSEYQGGTPFLFQGGYARLASPDWDYHRGSGPTWAEIVRTDRGTERPIVHRKSKDYDPPAAKSPQ
jgi:hypothetical protein